MRASILYRTFSTAAPSRKLKKYLNRLFQKVHPDFFSQHPEARDVNLRSFQILQASLQHHFHSDGETPAQGGDPVTNPTSLTFFSFIPNSPQLRKTHVQLSSGRRSLTDALGTLFDNLNLQRPPIDVLNPPTSTHSFTRIGELGRIARRKAAHRATVHQMKVAEQAFSQASKIGDAKVLILGLQRAHGVKITVCPSVPDDHRMTALLYRLRDALSDSIDQCGTRAKPPLRDAVILLDGGFEAKRFVEYGLSRPTVLLGACATRQQWDIVLQDEEFLKSLSAHRDRAAELRGLEIRAAEALNIRMVLHNFQEGTDAVPAYIAVLKELIKRSEIGSNDEGLDVSLMLVPGGDVTTDGDMGAIIMGIDVPIDEMDKLLREELYEISEEHRRIVTKREFREREKRAMKKELRLGSLSKDDDVTDEEWGECVRELRRRSRTLRGHFDGADVRIVRDKADVTEDGVLRLPYDFGRWMKE